MSPFEYSSQNLFGLGFGILISLLLAKRPELSRLVYNCLWAVAWVCFCVAMPASFAIGFKILGCIVAGCGVVVVARWADRRVLVPLPSRSTNDLPPSDDTPALPPLLMDEETLKLTLSPPKPPKIYIDFSFGSVFPTYNETSALHFFAVLEDETGKGPCVLHGEAKTFNQSDERWASIIVGADERLVFLRARVINESNEVVTGVRLTFAVNTRATQPDGGSDHDVPPIVLHETVEIDRLGIGDAGAHTLYMQNGTERFVTFDPVEAAGTVGDETSELKVTHGNLLMSFLMPFSHAQQTAKTLKPEPKKPRKKS